MATRIYQGRIVSAEYENSAEGAGQVSAVEALIETFKLFQDAANYHLVALAGMAEDGGVANQGIGAWFKERVRDIWAVHPKGKAEAKTLQQSVTQTLNLRENASFEEAVAVIFDGCERKDVLPYVQQLIMDRTQKGDGAIQQEGRSLLPKLCDVAFGGNYDFSKKEKIASAGNVRLIRELGRDNITQAEFESLADEMDLSWAAIKTQPNEDHTGSLCYTQEETVEKVREIIDELSQAVIQKSDAAWEKFARDRGVNLYDEVQRAITSRPIINSAHLLAKNNKTAPALKQAAVFFMYYPCEVSAGMLKAKLGKEKVEKLQIKTYDCSSLENDPILLARGTRGYVYPGFTALPAWQKEGAAMYSSEWDILAFKEALKTLHSYELKTQERLAHKCTLEAELTYMLKGEGKPPAGGGESDSAIPVLGGDPRYELLSELIQEISLDKDKGYTISHRALNAYDEVREQWMRAEKKGDANEEVLRAIVRKVQGGGGRFGSGVLFEALCQEKYHPIWHDWIDTAKKRFPRSENMLKDFGRVQELQSEIEQYSSPVRITAAESEYSPRQLLFSDLGNFGVKSSGHEFVKGRKGMLRLRVAVRDALGRLTGATILVRYSAPRFERDELGLDAAHWSKPKKGEDTTVPWLQPMMKALNIDERLIRLQKEPAVALQVKNGGVCLLNFPVTLDLEPLQQYMGKASLWRGQMLGGQDEKLHLHWPATYKGKDIPWWENAVIKEHGFNVLGIDLGMRYAAAWTLTHVQKEDKYYTKRGTQLCGRFIGSAGGQDWYGYSLKQGLMKIDGEGHQSLHQASRKSDCQAQLPAGITGASEEDKALAKGILNKVGMPMPEKADYDVLLLGNAALRAFSRLLSRFRRYQSILVKLKDRDKQESALKEARDFFDYNEVTRRFIPKLINKIDEGNIESVCDLLLAGLLELRASLPGLATDLANLILPRKRGTWQWVEASKGGYICAGRLELQEGNTPKRRVFHRGGLSVRRLTQLEKLRQVLQSLNRVLWMEPGVTTPFGRALKDIPVEDPCPDLLTKIENVREERVNKIAHDIVAQALGVKLKKSRTDKNIDGRDIIHGEYEMIPGRKPVDFVVLENLSRYMTSIDRSSDENITLMRWAHRQLVAKVKQLLEEVFGIPVLCTHAAYTSKFDALTSAPGFRARELDDALIKHMAQSSDPDEHRLGSVYSRIMEKFPKHKRPVGFKLLAPDSKNGGEFFVSPTDTHGVRVTNADINAAINIAWRGIAAPEALPLLHRLRLEKKKEAILPREVNQREKALKGRFTLEQLLPLDESESSSAAFCLPFAIDGIAPFAVYRGDTGESFMIASSRELWKHIKDNRWSMCNKYNLRLLEKNIPTTELAELLKEYMNLTTIFMDDDLPL